MEYIGELFTFLWAVISNWAGLTTGGVVVALLWLWSTIKQKSLSKRFALGTALFFLFLAFFNAWRDQYTQIKGQRAYVRIMVKTAPYIPKMRFPLFRIDERPYINYGVEVSNGSFATHTIVRAQLEIHDPICPLPKDLTDLGQMSCTPTSPKIENEVFQRIQKDIHFEQGMGSTYIPGDQFFNTAYLSHNLSADEIDALQAGTKLMYIVGYTRWEDGAGTHEWKYCAWVVPPANEGVIGQTCLSHNEFLEKAED